MKTTATPTRAQLVGRAADLVPVLAAHAVWQEENRRLHPEAVDAIADAGLLRMRTPERYGGYESDMTTVVDVISQVALGDGSAGWTLAVWAISAWMTGMFPDETQDEVFGSGDVRISGILSPGAVAAPVPGGVVVNGRWAFNSGALHSTWNTNAAVLVGEGEPQPVMLMLPLADLQIVDDWHTAGLRGSGSVTTVAADVFVPERRLLPMGPVLQGRHRSLRNADSAIYNAPFMPTACTTVSAPAYGLARAARAAFQERLPGRKISYTAYEHQSEAPLTHLQVAEAAVKADEAGFHVHRAAGLLDAKTAAREQWTVEERARIRLDMGAACRRAKEAVDVLSLASGGSSVYRDVPIQRIARDIQTVNLHSILHPDTNDELYGRIACGLEPNTLFL